jgi:hypothetical protein
MMHQGTNGGEAYQKKCLEFWESQRFYIELAYLQEQSFAGAARELNRKGHKSMKGGKYHPMTVKCALEVLGVV